MAKLSLSQLKEIVSTYVDANKLSSAEFNVTRNNTLGLVDKISKIFTLDTEYVDKLSILDGEEFSYGKAIEEWQMDLTLPEDYDETGANTLAPHDPTHRPDFYSQSLGKKVIPTTIRYNDLQRAVHNAEQLVLMTTMISKRLSDSEAVYRYNVKRELLGKMVGFCEAAKTSAVEYGATTKYEVGKYVKSTSDNEYGIIVKAKSTTSKDWQTAKKEGFVIVLDLVKELAIPTDTATGEAFVKQIKVDVEKAQDISEGHSLNGNTLGASNTLVLFVKQGIMPTLDVDVLAGAFHEEKLASPVEIKVIKDFGTATDAYAILMDSRGIRLHNTNRMVLDNLNGQGGFINYFLHTENTGYISRNIFVRVFKKPQA